MLLFQFLKCGEFVFPFFVRYNLDNEYLHRNPVLGITLLKSISSVIVVVVLFINIEQLAVLVI